MGIYQLVLALKLEEIGPNERFFLARFIYKYKLEVVPMKSVVDLATALGMDQRPVYDAISSLAKAGYFVTGARKLGQYNYLCSTKLRGALTLLAENRSPAIHEKLIESVMVGLVELCDGKGRSLKNSHRLLFAILLFHADAFGVVRDLSVSDLQKLTGMKLDTLKYHLAQLSKYIRGRISGTTGVYLFGVIKGVFFLDTSGAKFVNDSSPRLTYSIFEFVERDMGDRCFRLAQSIERQAHPGSGNLGLPHFHETLMKVFFKDGSASRLDQHLQFKLEEYAVSIIKDRCRNNSNDIAPTFSRELMDKIYTDLFPQNMSRNGITAQVDRKKVAKYIYALSHQMANSVQEASAFYPSANKCHIEVMILPLSSTDRILAVWWPSHNK